MFISSALDFIRSSQRTKKSFVDFFGFTQFSLRGSAALLWWLHELHPDRVGKLGPIHRFNDGFSHSTGLAIDLASLERFKDRSVFSFPDFRVLGRIVS